MNNKFDEMTKGLAQSVARRSALKKFGLGLIGTALASLGLADKARAGHCKPSGSPCSRHSQCCSYLCFNPGEDGGERLKSVCA